MTSRPHHGVIALVGAGIMSLACLTGCDNDDSQPANKPPTIQLTAGPMDGDSTAWNANFQWLGHDPDGLIDHYQYALDVPPDLMDAIDDPGPSDIAWQTTTATEGSFPFTTPSPDSVYGTDGTPGPPTRYTGQNTFVIRAVDEDGGISRAEYVAFTGLNYAPRTLLNGGEFEADDVLEWDKWCPPRLTWTSEDPETPGVGSAEIAGYEYKLREMPFSWSPVGRDTDELIEALEGIPWIPLPPDSTELSPAIRSGFPYIFAVRALDRGAAREDVLIKGRNLLVAYAYSNDWSELPSLTVRDQVVGTLKGLGYPWEAQVAAGTDLQFEMTGDTADYDGTIDTYNYGVDVDPDSDDSGPGWSGWSNDRLTDVIRLDELGIHTLVFKARVSLECRTYVTQVILVVRVIPMAFDRELLYVDDFRRATSQGFTDADQDRRNREMFAAAGIDVNSAATFGQFDAWGPSDQQPDPTLLTLADLSPYKMVYWDVLGSGLTANPALVAANACESGKVLQAYVAGGGALWVTGQRVFAPFDLASGGGCRANNAYEFGNSQNGLSFGPGDFLCDFMRLCGGGFYYVRTSPEAHGLSRVEPTTRGASAGFATLGIDRTVVVNDPTISFTDAMLVPFYEATGGLDSLYRHRTPTTTSGMDRKPNAFRYHDPNPIPDQGPVAVFGFPLFLLEQGSVEQGTGTFKAARVMVDWLRSEQQRFFEARAPRGSKASGGR